MPEISIIVPVYKVEKYIHRCVDSILAQSFTDFELILVDDGSPDNCGVICDAYAASDSRIRVIHQKNQGQAAARNAGIEAAKGEWILFCDADDCYNQDVLGEYLNSLGRKEQSVLYCFNFYDAWPGGIQKEIKYPETELMLFGTDEHLTCLSGRISHKSMGYSIWNKIYSRELLNQFKIRFFERSAVGNKDDWAEDLTFNLQYCMCVEQICVSEEPVYLLSKHGTPEEQNENGLIGRLDHMLRIFLELEKTPAYRQSPEIEEQFWKIVVWHMRRYLYLDAGAKGAEMLRQECLESPYWEPFSAWIHTALDRWREIENRWDPVNGTDYKYLLEYLRGGNMLAYKIKNVWLWRIRPKFLR